jgi:hypothetical protein
VKQKRDAIALNNGMMSELTNPVRMRLRTSMNTAVSGDELCMDELLGHASAESLHPIARQEWIRQHLDARPLLRKGLSTLYRRGERVQRVVYETKHAPPNMRR